MKTPQDDEAKNLFPEKRDAISFNEVLSIFAPCNNKVLP